jgi:hypothetical protein
MVKNEMVIHPLKTGYLNNRKNHGKRGVALERLLGLFVKWM